MSTTNNPTVLLVDDDHDYLDQMALRFEHAGYEVVTAFNENEAQKILSKMKPDLAVIDLMMDQMDGGFTLAYTIKSMDENIPVILVTGVAAETGLAFERAGAGAKNWIKADAVLAKPVRFEQIISELERLGVNHE